MHKLTNTYLVLRPSYSDGFDTIESTADEVINLARTEY